MPKNKSKNDASSGVTDIEGLAVMVARGFQSVDARFDKMELETNDRFANLEHEMLQNFRDVRRDIAELQQNMISRAEFDDVLGRIKYIEMKLGIESGK